MATKEDFYSYGSSFAIENYNRALRKANEIIEEYGKKASEDFLKGFRDATINHDFASILGSNINESIDDSYQSKTY